MTSDAKVGVLLGLAFIFIIAFAINGLPHFREEVNNNELTTTMINSHSNSSGIGAKERKVTREVRFQAALPQKTSANKQSEGSVDLKPIVKAESSVLVKVDAKEKIYVVSEGDSLSVIASKVYGSGGNEEKKVARIFKANRKFLRSVDEIYIGQRLVIPSLSGSISTRGKASSILASSTVEKIESAAKNTKGAELYFVQENDSLWAIAAKQLGDGSRYTEIAKLNADILDDQDSLVVGMCLKLP